MSGLNGEAVVRVESLHKWFGPLEVLRGIDMDVQGGEVIVILGGAPSST